MKTAISAKTAPRSCLRSSANARRSTVEDIKRQLAYREENEKLVRDFNPDVMFDGSKKVYISTVSEAFIVTGSSNWRSANPDIIKLSQVVAVDTNIKENREEIFFEDSDGNRKSYQPPRYECDYEFDVVIRVNSRGLTVSSLR